MISPGRIGEWLLVVLITILCALGVVTTLEKGRDFLLSVRTEEKVFTSPDDARVYYQGCRRDGGTPTVREYSMGLVVRCKGRGHGH